MSIDILDLKQDKEHKLRCAEDLVLKAEKEGRDLTDEEQATCDSYALEAEKLDVTIKDLTSKRETQNRIKERVAGLRQPEPRQTPPSFPTAPPMAGDFGIVVPKSQRVYSNLKSFHGPHAERDAYVAGMWFLANFHKKDNKGEVARRWMREHRNEIYNNLSEDVNSGGGILVPPPELERAIITLRENYGVARRNCDLYPMESDVLRIPRRSQAMQAYFIGDNPAGGATTSDLNFDSVQLVAKDLAVTTLFSRDLAMDAVINLGDRIANEMAWSLALKEDQCLFNGDGTSTYGGIKGLTTIFQTGFGGASALYGAVASPNSHTTFETLDNVDMTTLMATLPDYAQMNAKFYCSRGFAHSVFSRLAAVAGGNTTQTLTEGVKLSYLGYPIEISQVLPNLPTNSYTNTAVCFFGDLSYAAALGERAGIEVSTTLERYWELRMIGTMSVERIDINVHDVGYAQNQTAAQGVPNAGPIVALVI